MLDTARRTRSRICGATLVADSSGALYWPAERTLLVADLHLEKGSAHAERGTLLPPYDTRETLARLADAIDALRAGPRSSRWATASTTLGAAERIGADDLADALQALQEERDWIWIAGNHDPEIAARAGGRVADELEIAGLDPAPRSRQRAASRTRSPATCTPPPSSSMYGTTIRRPCFVGNGRRLVMPAFGAFTGGLNVLDDAFPPLFGNGGIAVWMLGRRGSTPSRRGC